MTECIMKAHNYHQTLELTLNPTDVLVSFRTLFWFSGLAFLSLVLVETKTRGKKNEYWT